MTRRGRWLFASLGAFALFGALWLDTIGWAGRRGEAALRAGDVPAAMASLAWASRLGVGDAVQAYNLGVGFYRMGDFARAERQFSAALATAGPGLAQAARFNRGNARYRLAEGGSAGDREARGRWYGGAMADYSAVLAGYPEAADARVNLDAARRRYAVLMAATAKGKAQQADAHGAAGNPSPVSGRQTGDKRETRQAEGKSGQTNRSRQGEAPRDASGQGESRRDLTRAEAERLLNDARGRERLAGPLHAGGRAERLAGPEKDW